MLEDVQARADERGIVLDRVGVAGVKRPVMVPDTSGGKQPTIAEITLSVSLAADTKGAHLSRFMEALENHGDEFTLTSLPQLLAATCRRLGSDRAELVVAFTYFRERQAPVTGARGLIDYECRLQATLTSAHLDIIREVTVPVTSLCPCSRDISDYGAHNQRGRITIRVRCLTDDEPDPRWIEHLADLAESAASSPLYPVLKRPDERFVTMHAYDHPVFVEDMVRSVAVDLQADEEVAWFEVEAVNDESIHNHSAFARASWSRHMGAGA